MITKLQFIKNAESKFGQKFNYIQVPDVIPTLEKTEVEIECPEHGFWKTKVKSFLKSKYGCPMCARVALSKKAISTSLKLSTTENPIVEDLKNPKIVPTHQIIGTIYCFVNTINNKIYIGKTLRNNYNIRFNEHKKRSNSKCVYFYRAILKYGWEKFEKYILYQTNILENTKENKKLLNEVLREKEIYYISLYNSNNPEHGYNLTAGGDGVTGYTFSKESKQKMSKNRSGKNHWNYGKTNNAGKRILQYDLSGNLIKEWDSMSDVERHGIAKACNISECCNGNADSTGGFVWVFASDKIDNLNEKLEKAKRKSNDKSVLEFDLNGKIINEYISASEAARQHGCDTSSISGAAHGKFDWALGHIWIYKTEFNNELLTKKLQIVSSKHSSKRSRCKVTFDGYNKH